MKLYLYYAWMCFRALLRKLSLPTIFAIVIWCASLYITHLKTSTFDGAVNEYTQAGISFGVGYVFAGKCDGKSFEECQRSAVLYLEQSAVENTGEGDE